MQEQSIFVEALDKEDPTERAAFLAQVCAGSPGLRQRVEKLLQRHQEADSFLEVPVAAPPGTIDVRLTERPGTVIGPYKLLQQIGEGGMGVVYMAEQQEPIRRRVALKIIKPGMDSAQVIARFEAERQALAMMDHQNIAKVLDAGTTDSGRPYFVMELVHGVPLTKYCDDHQLTPRQRLELFIPVCHAIQHAHQKGIIHRDLKPSNILVTMYDDKPVPKVIDFGVAKAVEQRLTEKTLFTHFGTLVGTFEYMSPEQAEMNAFGVDTRSDVYSLGVLLFELLTGSTPLERQRLRTSAYGDIVRLIKEEEPPRPSTRLSSSGEALAGISRQRGTAPAQLAELMRGELDWIVMRCLEKDRTRRYETANGLARDVDRYLKDEPVEACPPTVGYKMRKFARKHKHLLATAAAFAAVLLLGVAGSGWQAVRATQAEVAALANEQQANANAVQAELKEQEANRLRDEAQKQRDEVRALNEQLQRTLYASQMNLAKHAWDADGVARVRELLENYRPKAGETDLRGFEWNYLNRLCHSEVLTQVRKKDSSGGSTLADRSVAFSPDGKWLALGGFGSNYVDARIGQVFSEVQIWDAETGKQLRSIPGGGTCVAFSPDGNRLASGSANSWDVTKKAEGAGELKVWETQTGKQLLKIEGGGTIVAFSPDGKRLTSASGSNFVVGEVKVWDAQTGMEILSLKGHTRGVGSLAFSPDGKRLASGSVDKTVKVWDAQTGQELLTIKGGAFSVEWSSISVAFSPDGNQLAICEKVFDARTGQELCALQGFNGQINSVTFSPDGKRLASVGGRPGRPDTSVRIWDAKTGQELFSLKGHTGNAIESVAFSPDGTRLATYGWDGTVKLWDATSTQEARTFNMHANNVTSVVFSPDGKRVASASVDQTVKMWDVLTGKELVTCKGHTGAVNSVAFSPDGKRLASGAEDKSVKVWDAQSGQELFTCKGQHSTAVNSVAFSPDGRRLASGSGGTWGKAKQASVPGAVKVWDAETGQELVSFNGAQNGENLGYADRPGTPQSFAQGAVFQPLGRDIDLQP
jgi:WD40 repeat protein/serine/threonine protein kinase